MADEEQFTLNSVNILKLKVSDLKRELKSRGLNSSGNKMELVERLAQAIQQTKGDDGSADSVDELIDEDDVLNDEEIEDEVGDYKNLELEISDKSFELDSSTSSKTLKRKNSERNNSTDSVSKSTKKITLNRHLSSDVEPTDIIEPTPIEANGKIEEKKVIKLSELSAKERLEMRAKKFGTPLSLDAKKIVRAERFGQAARVTSTGKNTITLGNTTTDLEALKKRAERFGSIVSTQLSKVERDEKLEQRKARFGASTGASTTINGAATEEQKAKRLERFKTSLK